MHYAHDIGRATELLGAATSFMSQRTIAPTPTNYAVWYVYAAGDNHALSTELRALIAGQAEFDETLNRRLYESYFGLSKISMAIATAGAELSDRMSRLGRDLEGAGRETSVHCQHLAAMIDEGAVVTSPEHVLTLMRSVLDETKAIIDTNQTLEGQLGAAVKEIETLRQSLDHARKEAMSDPLTGVVNRKYLDIRLAEQTELSAASGQSLSLILLDIDNFKDFNDTYGHQVGDQVLRAVVRAVSDSIRGGDILARYGGEEFCVILPDTPLNGGAAVAENIRRTIASKTLKGNSDGRDYGTITASFGVTDYKPGEAADALIERADAALYTAKNRGRNQIMIQSHSSDES